MKYTFPILIILSFSTKDKKMFKILSIFTFLILGYNQGISQDMYLRDSIIEEPTSILLKKILLEVNDKFLNKRSLSSLKPHPNKIVLDTNSVVSTYHILKSRSGQEYSLIQKKKIEILCDKEIGIIGNANLIFEEGKIPNVRVPKLEIKIVRNGITKIIEVYVYSQDYWMLTENTTLLSCGYYHVHTLNIYEKGNWTEVVNTNPKIPSQRL